MEQHIKWKHAEKKPWKCDECDNTYAVERGLIEHKTYFHAKESDFKLCPSCPYKTPNKAALKSHINAVHKKILRFTCDQCAHQFYQKYQLTNHIKSK